MMLFLVFFFALLTGVLGIPFPRPHIIFILGDDIGYNDVGWHNKNFYTPFMNHLASTGVTLENYYTFTQCSPSRASLLTGIYSDRLGIQRWVLGSTEPYGVPLCFSMIPEELKKVGYRSHAIGKWHIGYCDWRYTPTYRGFESWIGFYNGAEENYEHCEPYFVNRTNGQCPGFDFRRGTEAAHEFDGQYSGEIYAKRAVEIIRNHRKEDGPLFLYIALTDSHFPLQAPQRFVDRCKNNVNEARRRMCGTMASTDEEVKNITMALKETGLYKNSVIIFASDNGGSAQFGGNNYPLRGEKGSLYEGGARAPAFVHSPLLFKKGYTNYRLIHVTDWYPTILRLAGGRWASDVDGVDQWDTICFDKYSRRKSVPYLIDVLGNGTMMAAVRDERYKLIAGPGGISNSIVPEEKTIDDSFNQSALVVYTAAYYLPFDFSDTSIKLYDLQNDPTESHNLADIMPMKLEEMKSLLSRYQQRTRPAFAIKSDTRGEPSNFNNTFTPGWCEAYYYTPD